MLNHIKVLWPASLTNFLFNMSIHVQWKTLYSEYKYIAFLLKFENFVYTKMENITLLMTASCASASRILNQTPISWALSATGRRVSHTNLWASSRISTQLFSRANRGASGKAATNIVIKPNCSTASKFSNFKWRNKKLS